jgi:hypothetical protein
MKGIYLTEKSKKEIDAKIVELNNEEWSPYRDGQIDVYKEILQSATILPIEESWDNVLHSTKKHKEYDYDDALKIDLPNGVIIQPK